MKNKNGNIKKIAGISWLVLAVFLVTMATATAGGKSDFDTELSQGVTLGAPMDGR